MSEFKHWIVPNVSEKGTSGTITGASKTEQEEKKPEDINKTVKTKQKT